jgi:hypothetical protein
MNPVAEDKLEVPLDAVKVVYAKDQPQYLPLPVIKFQDGTIYSEWELTPEELAAILASGKIRVRLWQWTFNQSLQPIKIELLSECECGCGRFVLAGCSVEGAHPEDYRDERG